jgi:hypothetical protein
LPRARKVTPAIDSDIRRVCANVARLGQKKSLAAIPIALNRKLDHIICISIVTDIYHEDKSDRSNIMHGAEIEVEVM